MLKKILFALSIAGLFASVSEAHAENYSLNAMYGANFYWQASGDPGWAGVVGACIGGKICGKDTSFKVTYFQNFISSSVYINAIEVYCNDNIGDKTTARLELWVDGQYKGSKDVKKAGSTLIFQLGRDVQEIELRSVEEDYAYNGDETAILSYRSY